MPKPSQMLDGPDMRAFLGACLIYYGRFWGDAKLGWFYYYYKLAWLEIIQNEEIQPLLGQRSKWSKRRIKNQLGRGQRLQKNNKILIF